MYFRMKFALFFCLFDSWYIIKYLLTETSGKQQVLWTLDCLSTLSQYINPSCVQLSHD